MPRIQYRARVSFKRRDGTVTVAVFLDTFVLFSRNMVTINPPGKSVKSVFGGCRVELVG